MSKYQQPATFNASIGQERKNWMIERAVEISKITKINSNASAVICEAIDCYREVLSLFGEDWEGHLKVQSEPKWAKDHILKIIDLLEKMPLISAVEQKELITEIRQSMDVGDMLE